MFRFLPFQSPARFRFVDPDTQHLFDAPNKEALVRIIVNYRAQNKLPPIEHLNLVLEDFWCRMKENASKCEEYKLKRGWFATLHGGVNVLKNIFFGDENMVDVGEAERRASICVKCPHNVFVDYTGFIKWSDEIADASTGGKRTKFNNLLGNCEVCSCPLRALVWSKEAAVEKEHEAMTPHFCWKRDGNKPK